MSFVSQSLSILACVWVLWQFAPLLANYRGQPNNVWLYKEAMPTQDACLAAAQRLSQELTQRDEGTKYIHTHQVKCRPVGIDPNIH